MTAVTALLQAESVYEQSPIRYWDRPVRDVVSDWERGSHSGRGRFDSTTEQAFLREVLEELDVPVSSQTLVFSKTSFQVDRIDPLTPRALYFSDKHYVGWVPGGEIEIATLDPKVGFTFYRVERGERPGKLHILRDQGCLFCHAGRDQNPYPGLVLLSTPTDEKGTGLGSRGRVKNIDHRNPMEERWAGWYVTGQWSGPRHRGNVWFANDDTLGAAISAKDRDFGPELANVDQIVDMSRYLTNTSDVLALLVLEHQTLVHNRLAQAFGNTRIGLYADESYMVGEGLSAETQELFAEETKRLLDAFLFKNEASLEEHRIGADSPFRADFLAEAVTDEQGRSLRQFDLDGRLFRYRCSYLIHAEAFQVLPELFREHFLRELAAVLDKKEGEGAYPYLGDEERQAIRQILTDTGVLPA